MSCLEDNICSELEKYVIEKSRLCGVVKQGAVPMVALVRVAGSTEIAIAALESLKLSGSITFKNDGSYVGFTLSGGRHVG